MQKTNILIIGAGMAGVSAAIFLKRMNVEFTILEANKIGGLLHKINEIDNFPAKPHTSGEEIIEDLKDQLNFIGVSVKNEKVQTILKNDEGFEVKTDVENYFAKAVIVATGQNQKSNLIPNEEKYAGSGVSYCATCDGNFFKGQDVAVIGNNNVALEEAVYLSNLVKKLYFVCPDNSIIGDQELLKKLQQRENVEFVLNANNLEIVGDDFGVTGLNFNSKHIDVFGVFPYVGEKTSTQILNNLKPEMSGIYVKVNEFGMSNIPGLFVAGDLANRKLKQLVTAASDGASAGFGAMEFTK